MAKFLNLLKLRGFTTAADAAVEISTTTDSASASRLRIDAGGKLTWGDGINAGDTNLYRQIANVLQTDDYFVATGGLTVESYQITTNGASTGNTLVFDGTKFTPGNATGGAAGSTYVTTIGNGASTTFAVTHNLNTRDVFVQVRGATSPYEVIDVQWEATSTSVVTFNFGTPPALNSVRVAIYAAVTGDNVAIPLDALTDVVITAPEEFQSLTYNGASWVNTFAPVVTYVRNAEATTLTTGTVVYLFGATGDHATVKRADNDSDSTSSKTIGLVAAPIAASENGPVVTRGYVDGIDLSVGYTAGDVLWLGEDGAFTTTKPTAPEHLVFIGVVVRATNNGIIYVATQNGYELDELHDVSLPSPNAGDVLTYNGSLWVAASAGGSSVTVNDTAPVSPEVGDLWYKSDTGQTFVYYDSYWVEIGGAGSLPDGSVTAAKLGTGAVTTAKLADASVTTDKIAAGAVVTVDLANNAITQAKLDTAVPLGGMRNRIINGDFRVNQRNLTSSGTVNGSALGNGAYGYDRWWFGWVGGTSLCSAQTFSVGNTITGEEPENYMRVSTTGQSSGNYSHFAQRIEDVRTFAGQQVVLSFWAKADTTRNVAIELQQSFGSGGSPSSTVLTYAGTISLTTSWTRHSLTFTVPSISGKTVGTSDKGYLAIAFFVSAGTGFEARTNSLGIQNGTFDFWGVQLEKGSQVTPFEQRFLGVELQLCQRYYWRSTAGLTTDASSRHAHFRRMNQYAHVASGHCAFPVPMRTDPTVSLYNGNGLGAVDGYGVGQESYVIATAEGTSPYGIGMFVKYTNSSLTTASNFNVDATSVTYWANIEASAEL